MSVEETDKIDSISRSTAGKVVLTISDHLPWETENDHLLKLRNKIDSYLDFIEKDELLFEPEYAATNPQIIIEVALEYETDNVGQSFLKQCKEQLEKQKIEFNWYLSQ